MKRNLIVLLTAFLVAAALVTSCAPTVSSLNTSIGGSQSSETTVLNSGSTTLKSASGALNFTTAIAVSLTGLVNTDHQHVYLDFNGQIDASTVAAGVFFYPLTDAPDNFTRFVRGTALPFTYSIQGTRMYITLDCTTVTKTTIELFIDATVLTANNGALKRDVNVNGILGEAADSTFSAVTVGAAPAPAVAPTALTTGTLPNPATPLTVTPTGLLAGSATLDIANYATGALTFTTQDSGSSATPNLVAVTGAATVYKNVSGVWTVAPSTTSILTTGAAPYLATITLTPAPKSGESYKVVIDKAKVVETTAVLGSIHSGSYLTGHAVYPTALVTYYTFNTSGAGNAVPQDTLAAAAGGANFARFLDVTVGASPIDLSTLADNNFKIALVNPVLATGTYTGTLIVPYSSLQVIVTTTTIFNGKTNAVTGFRLYLPTSIKSLAGGDTMLVGPTVMSMPNATTPAQDLLSFGKVSTNPTTGDGWQVVGGF